ncbi:MAG: nicotinamide-nucleotide amidohydrolase family protein [Steroidobacteraceae bacterium]
MPTDNELALLALRLGESLLQRGLTIATAESCTGGYLSKLITDMPGSSRWFDSGVVTYSNEAKQRQLGVSAETLESHGAVSEATVIEMAVGALVVSSAHRSIAISGVAGPDGGSQAHPVGEVWFGRAVRMPNGQYGAMGMRRQFDGNRDAVRRHSVAYALQMLLEA